MPSETHDRAVTPSRTFQRPRERDLKYQTLHTSAYQTPQEYEAAAASNMHGHRYNQGHSHHYMLHVETMRLLWLAAIDEKDTSDPVTTSGR